MNEKNKRKAILGTIVATGLAAGVACTSPSPADNSNASEQSERVSAADKIVIDGKEVKPIYNPQRKQQRSKTQDDMREIETVYGPPPPED